MVDQDARRGMTANLSLGAPARIETTAIVDLYNRIAPRYDRLHRRWLRHAGGEAQAALEAAVRALATPETRLLDAGCGTGAFVRALQAEGIAPAQVTLLDPSGAMLARCADLPMRRVQGRLEALPFHNGAFDIVTCAWALETTADPTIALRELLRVTRRGGTVCLVFCATEPAIGVTGWLMRRAVQWRGSGRFLDRESIIADLRAEGDVEVRPLPIHGPAAGLLVRLTVDAGAFVA